MGLLSQAHTITTKFTNTSNFSSCGDTNVVATEAGAFSASCMNNKATCYIPAVDALLLVMMHEAEIMQFDF